MKRFAGFVFAVGLVGATGCYAEDSAAAIKAREQCKKALEDKTNYEARLRDDNRFIDANCSDVSQAKEEGRRIDPEKSADPGEKARLYQCFRRLSNKSMYESLLYNVKKQVTDCPPRPQH